MDGLQFVADVIKTLLSGPAIVLYIFLLTKDELFKLIPRVKRVEAGWLKLELFRLIERKIEAITNSTAGTLIEGRLVQQQIEASAIQQLDPVTQSGGGATSDGSPDQLPTEAEYISPHQLRIVQAWQPVEKAIRQLDQRHERNLSRLIGFLEKDAAIWGVTRNVLDWLLRLRNIALHGVEDFTSDEVQRYEEMADYALALLSINRTAEDPSPEQPDPPYSLDSKPD